MRRSFSFVFMGVLGFSAAVGASSFATSENLNRQNGSDIGQAENEKGVGSEVFDFSSTSAAPVAVSVTTTIGPFDDGAGFNGAPAGLAGPTRYALPSIETGPLDAAPTLVEGVFELTQDDAPTGAFRQPARTNPAASPLAPLALSLGGGGSGSSGGTSSGEAATTVQAIADDTDQTSPSPVPVPASALLLGTALLGAGTIARRKKRG